jgi:hypothetical protein
MSNNVSEEHMVSVVRIEDYAKENSGLKAAGKAEWTTWSYVQDGRTFETQHYLCNKMFKHTNSHADADCASGIFHANSFKVVIHAVDLSHITDST